LFQRLFEESTLRRAFLAASSQPLTRTRRVGGGRGRGGDHSCTAHTGRGPVSQNKICAICNFRISLQLPCVTPQHRKMFPLRLFLAVFLQGLLVAGDGVAFQATDAVTSLIPDLKAAALRVVRQHKSSDVGGSYLAGIGSTTRINVFTNWPVPAFVSWVTVGCDLL
jgi:hypothetical protein